LEQPRELVRVLRARAQPRRPLGAARHFEHEVQRRESFFARAAAKLSDEAFETLAGRRSDPIGARRTIGDARGETLHVAPLFAERLADARRELAGAQVRAGAEQLHRRREFLRLARPIRDRDRRFTVDSAHVERTDEDEHGDQGRARDPNVVARCGGGRHNRSG
jgi:hypothetical protein